MIDRLFDKDAQKVIEGFGGGMLIVFGTLFLLMVSLRYIHAEPFSLQGWRFLQVITLTMLGSGAVWLHMKLR